MAQYNYTLVPRVSLIIESPKYWSSLSPLARELTVFTASISLSQLHLSTYCKENSSGTVLYARPVPRTIFSRGGRCLSTLALSTEKRNAPERTAVETRGANDDFDHETSDDYVNRGAVVFPMGITVVTWSSRVCFAWHHRSYCFLVDGHTRTCYRSSRASCMSMSLVND